MALAAVQEESDQTEEPYVTQEQPVGDTGDDDYPSETDATADDTAFKRVVTESEGAETDGTIDEPVLRRVVAEAEESEDDGEPRTPIHLQVERSLNNGQIGLISSRTAHLRKKADVSEIEKM